MDQIFIKLNEWTNNFISNEQIKKYKKHTKKTKIDIFIIFYPITCYSPNYSHNGISGN